MLTRVDRSHQNSASTISELSMTYSTTASLVRAGQGVSCLLFFFLLSELGPAEAPLDNPETLEATTRPGPARPGPSNLPFSSLSCLRSSSILLISSLRSAHWSIRSITQLLTFPHFFQLSLPPWLNNPTTGKTLLYAL